MLSLKEWNGGDRLSIIYAFSLCFLIVVFLVVVSAMMVKMAKFVKKTKEHHLFEHCDLLIDMYKASLGKKADHD